MYGIDASPHRSMGMIQARIQWLGEKLRTIPVVAVLVSVGIFVGFAMYYFPLETNATVTNTYHHVVTVAYDHLFAWSNMGASNFRHLIVRAVPEVYVAAWMIQCAAMIFVVGGVLKQHNVWTSVHRLFWWPIVGLIAAVPGMLGGYYLLALANKHHFGKWLSAHTHIHIHLSLLSTHPGVVGSLQTFLFADGQKKLIAICGLFFFATWWMKPYFWNVQGWFAERRILKLNKKAGGALNWGPTTYLRWNHHLIPGYRLRIQYVAQNQEKQLHPERHTRKNNVVLWTARFAGLALFLGGLWVQLHVISGVI